jgi:POT family proton-dependent oligopeptide transporter
VTAAQAAARPVPGCAPDSSFFGHPRGLAYLAFTEAWERFSYYGMSALVVLYMVNQLLLPGHIENVVGFAGFRGAIEGLFGPLATQALASQIFGFYSGFVYFTPIIGGWIGDRLGQRSAVVLGALSMSGGHLAMAFDQSFLLALLLLIIGSGLLKGTSRPRSAASTRSRTRRAAPAALRSSALASISEPSPDRCCAAFSAPATAGTSASAQRPCSCSARSPPTSAAIATFRPRSSGRPPVQSR